VFWCRALKREKAHPSTCSSINTCRGSTQKEKDNAIGITDMVAFLFRKILHLTLSVSGYEHYLHGTSLQLYISDCMNTICI